MTEKTQISKTNSDFAPIGESGKQSRVNSVAFFLLCFILVFSTVAYGAVDFWALGLICIFTALLIAAWISDSFFSKEFRFDFNLLQLPILALIAIGCVQLLPLRSSNLGDFLSVPANSSLTLDASATAFAIVNLLVYFIFFSASFAFINDQKRLKKTVFTIIIFSTILAFYGILQRFAGLELIYGTRPPTQANPFGSYVNQHHFAALMEMTIGLTLGLIFGKATQKDKNPLLIISVVIMGIALLLTSSRGGYISLIAVVIFVITANLLLNRNKSADFNQETATKSRRGIAYIGGGFALIAGLFAAMLLLGGDESLLRGAGLQNPQEDFSNGRFQFWNIALQIFFDYPLLGAGLNSFGIVFPQYDTWNGNFRIEYAHNDYLQILADAGIIGFVSITGFIVLLFKKSLQTIKSSTDVFRRNTAIGALAGCFGILLHSFFDFPLRTPSNMFFFLILIVLATAVISHPKNLKRRSS